MSTHRFKSIPALVLVLAALSFTSGCAYYNYYYNAQKQYELAEKQRREASSVESQRKTSASGYDKSVESAAKVLAYYPGSKWEDDALLLIARSYYRAGKFRPAIGKVDELLTKYPESNFVEEGLAYKGLSLLRVAQSDSGRQILGDIFLNSTNNELKALGHFGLGEYYILSKRWDMAFEEFKFAAENSDKDQWLRAESWVRAGICLGYMKKYEEAVRLYEDILARKIPRKLRFEASLQKAAALRLSGRAEEARDLCRILLKDGAFVDEFPRVELELAKSARAMGEYDEAREVLIKLVETEKRGEIGAQGQYELGLLYWQINRNDTSALSALAAVKSTERSATVAPLADSLTVEIEALTKHYRKLAFLERQFALMDSARGGLRPMFAADTVWIDSSLIVKQKPEKPRGKTDRKGRRDVDRFEGDINDPIRKMVDEAMAAEEALSVKKDILDTADVAAPEVPADSVIAVADTTKPPLDSLQLAGVDSLRRSQRREEWLALAELHLFDRRDHDSTTFYISALLASDPTGGERARGIAALAFIARQNDDTLRYDSLYTEILNSPPDDIWKIRAEKALRHEIKLPHSTRAAELVDSAETLWREQGDAEAARLLYLLAVEEADSADTSVARALMGAAYITRITYGQDSLAGLFYADISKRFPNTPYAKAAQKHATRGIGKAQREEIPAPGEESDEFEDDYDPYRQEMAPDVIKGDAEVLDASKVDEPPQLMTAPEMVDSYLRSFYPFEAYADQVRGRVEVQLIVGANGEVSDVQVVKSDPEGYGFDEAAIQVIGTLSYRPGRQKGKPVDVRMIQVLTFKSPDEN